MRILRRLLFACLLAVSGCVQNSSSLRQSSSVQESEIQIDRDVYDSFAADTENRKSPASYVAAVQTLYTLTYTDTALEKFGMDAVLEVEDSSAKFSHYMDVNGVSLHMQGWYEDGRLYNDYNGLKYYEDMKLDDVRQLLIVPLDPAVFSQDAIKSISVTADGEEKTYTLVLTEKAQKEYFLKRYDFYGVDEFKNYRITDNRIVVRYDAEGRYLGEDVTFLVELQINDETVTLKYESTLKYSGLDETHVASSEVSEEELAAYINYQDIDPNAIIGEEGVDDTPEETVRATFEKRLVSRLGYEKTGEGKYEATFNDTEGYTIDFNNSQFTYSNHSIVYVYNWHGDVGAMGGCTVYLREGTQNPSCKEETVETIQEVKRYLEMELYYCGLSLEDLQNES
ncbi:MAG: hypothetical protein IKD69_10315 [Solobacterium sp.]|nr:hypothetical protein [Solobacterium sp.]